MRSVIVSFLFVMTMTIAYPLFGEDKIIVAASDNYPPYIDSGNPEDGLLMEIIRAAYTTQGYTVEIEYVPWARALSGLLKGTYDIIPDIYYNDSRTEKMQFSDPLVKVEIKIISRIEEKFDYTKFEDLRGKTIGVIRRYFYNEQFEAATSFSKIEASGLMQNINRLINRRIDLTLEDQLVAKTQMSELDISLLEKVYFSEEPFSVNELYLVSSFINIRCAELVGAFNIGLEEIKSNGVYNEIMEKYGIE